MTKYECLKCDRDHPCILEVDLDESRLFIPPHDCPFGIGETAPWKVIK